MRSCRQSALLLRSLAFTIGLSAVFMMASPTGLISQTRPRSSRARRSVIIDTDASSDDLMAIAFLLSRPDIRVEAVTIANGMARVPAGGRNVLRLLELAGRKDVPVYLGKESPLSGSNEFPAEWRRLSGALPGVTLPAAVRPPESRSAVDYLSQRLSNAVHPVEVLALGPLTNLAEVFAGLPRAARAIRRLVIMGGAIRVPGDLDDGGMFKTENTVSEWNMFIDPSAAKIVFASGAPIRLIPLDATQRVRIDMAMLEQFESHASTPLARFVSQVLASQSDSIRQGFYFAWDPLAAAALASPAVARFRPLAIRISDKPGEQGRTVEVKGRRANALVAVDANALRFRKVFMTALGVL
jgi:inosine-uridine nucleoside N-ribohydrolase